MAAEASSIEESAADEDPVSLLFCLFFSPLASPLLVSERLRVLLSRVCSFFFFFSPLASPLLVSERLRFLLSRVCSSAGLVPARL